MKLVHYIQSQVAMILLGTALAFFVCPCFARRVQSRANEAHEHSLSEVQDVQSRRHINTARSGITALGSLLMGFNPTNGWQLTSANVKLVLSPHKQLVQPYRLPRGSRLGIPGEQKILSKRRVTAGVRMEYTISREDNRWWDRHGEMCNWNYAGGPGAQPADGWGAFNKQNDETFIRVLDETTKTLEGKQYGTRFSLMVELSRRGDVAQARHEEIAWEDYAGEIHQTGTYHWPWEALSAFYQEETHHGLPTPEDKTGLEIILEEDFLDELESIPRTTPHPYEYKHLVKKPVNTGLMDDLGLLADDLGLTYDESKADTDGIDDGDTDGIDDGDSVEIDTSSLEKVDPEVDEYDGEDDEDEDRDTSTDDDEEEDFEYDDEEGTVFFENKQDEPGEDEAFEADERGEEGGDAARDDEFDDDIQLDDDDLSVLFDDDEEAETDD